MNSTTEPTAGEKKEFAMVADYNNLNEVNFIASEPRAKKLQEKPTSRVFFDASLTLHYGLENPVGIVRAEHYVAEFLMRDPSLSLDFVTFDREQGCYRPLSSSQRHTMKMILLHRYEQNSEHEEPLDSTENAEDVELISGLNIEISNEEQAESEATVIVLGNDAPPSTDHGPSALSIINRRFKTAISLQPDVFNSVLLNRIAELMPIKKNHNIVQRIGTRVARRSILFLARRSYAPLFKASRAWHKLVREDSIFEPETQNPAPALPPIEQSSPPADPIGNQVEHGTSMNFRRGDVIVSMANTWDYMNYEYLHNICSKDGVKLIAVVYDVIAMMHPFTTPGPLHLYQRHWVEIGHDAAHIVAISQHSMDTYVRYVCSPNDLNPSLSYAYLPNFLKARENEIGETPVDSLSTHPFVFFCSTIETRKNHQLLLHVWDRLREEIDIEKLPTLVFVGKWGWGTETVRLLVERNWRLRKRVRVLDRISDSELIWLYRHARFTVFPSISEGFGLAAAESLSFGTPVVISTCPALQEAAENLMPAIDPFDMPGWLEEMRRLIVDDSHLQTLREAASRYRGPSYEEFGTAIRNAVLSVKGGERSGSVETPH